MRWLRTQTAVLAIACLAGCQFLCAQDSPAKREAGCPANPPGSDTHFVTIADLTFAGDPRIDAQGLEQIATKLTQRSYVGSGESAASELEETTRRAWQDRGYFQVQVRGDARILTGSPVNQRIAVTLHIDAGTQYRLAGIRFKNNRAITNSKALRSLFSIEDGEIFQRSVVAKGLEDLRRAYGEYGYANVTLVPDAHVDEANQTISLEIDIDEGKQFYVREIRVVGADGLTSAELLRNSYLRPGDVYNQRLAEYFFVNPVLGLSASALSSSRIHLDLDEEERTVAVSFDIRPCAGEIPGDRATK